MSKKNTEPLLEGSVVTVEPGVYFEQDFGIRLEDFGIITRDGFEVFTQSTHDMVII
ncbi:MAG: M24 family metallopeptidase [Coriobacteriaceae bacterium]|nr:M24 family metallopeptidase [Coriobacteriaceae bacterium]